MKAELHMTVDLEANSHHIVLDDDTLEEIEVFRGLRTRIFTTIEVLPWLAWIPSLA